MAATRVATLAFVLPKEKKSHTGDAGAQFLLDSIKSDRDSNRLGVRSRLVCVWNSRSHQSACDVAAKTKLVQHWSDKLWR